MDIDTESISYWKNLNPDCTITDNPWLSSVKQFDISSADMDRHIEQLKHDGYFQTSPIVPEYLLSKLSDCIVNIVRKGHNTTYALLYDEFYHVLSRLKNILTPLLGQRFQFVPDEFEAYYIPVADAAVGSAPHRDSLWPTGVVNETGIPQLVNVWIPITDATTLNSCIHVIPTSLDPTNDVAYRDLSERTHISLGDVQNVRALPAKAGSILCWSPRLLHWGGRSSRYADAPRLSFAAYFQSRSHPPFHPTTMDIPSQIPFEYRVYLAEKVWRDPSGRMLSRYLPGSSCASQP